MPLYQYKCTGCGKSFERYSTIADRNEYKVCDECGEYANRDVECELASMGEFDATCKEHERWSWSMGVNVKDIPKMQAMYPGSDYHPKTGQLKVKSRAHKLFEMKRRGFEEYR